mgnify:CR=1 FL=1
MKFILIFSFLLTSALLASSRREARKVETAGPAVIEFPEPSSQNKLDKNALRSYRHLHRQGLRAFHQKEYQEGLQCFGLALQANPRSGDLILDYALFSLLTPGTEGRNLTLSKNLLRQLKKAHLLKDPRFHLSQAILNWLEGQDEQAKFNLNHLKSTIYDEARALFEVHIKLEARAINSKWAEMVIPIRLSPIEKRKKRSS